jgi:hypothetical protein
MDATEPLSSMSLPKTAPLAGVGTYGGLSVFVAFFVLGPNGAGDVPGCAIPRRLMPAVVGLGTLTFTMYHDGASGDARHPERHSDAVHHALRCARTL